MRRASWASSRSGCAIQRGQRDAADERDAEGEGAEEHVQPRLGVDLLGVVALGHHDLHQPLQIADGERHRPPQVALVVVVELERHVPLERRPPRGGRRQLGVDDLGPRGAGAAAADQHGPLPGGDEHAPARRDLQVFEGAGQPVEREVHGEDAAHAAGGVEQRRRAGDAEAAAGVELVGLRPRHVAARLGRAEVRSLRRPVLVVVGTPHRLPPAVGQEAVLLEADATAGREAAVDVDVAALVTPGADEPVGAIAVAHPAHVRMRAQHGQHEVLERAGIVGIELALLDEVQAHPGGGLGVLEDPSGVGGGEAGGLGHGRVDQRA